MEIFQFLYFTGARLAEIAGLQAEDLLEDRILIRPNEFRLLKQSPLRGLSQSIQDGSLW